MHTYFTRLNTELNVVIMEMTPEFKAEYKKLSKSVKRPAAPDGVLQVGVGVVL